MDTDTRATAYSVRSHQLVLWALVAGVVLFHLVAAVMPRVAVEPGVHWGAMPRPFLYLGIGLLLASALVRPFLFEKAREGPGPERLKYGMILCAVAEGAALFAGVAFFVHGDPTLSVIAVPCLIVTVWSVAPRGP
ncbi:MAG TPA: hypothetical protein VGD77_17410 [Gemmatimonadaceae bacterium]